MPPDRAALRRAVSSSSRADARRHPDARVAEGSERAFWDGAAQFAGMIDISTRRPWRRGGSPLAVDLARSTKARGLAPISAGQYMRLPAPSWKSRFVPRPARAVSIVLCALYATARTGLLSYRHAERLEHSMADRDLALAVAASIVVVLPTCATFDFLAYVIVTSLMFLLVGVAAALLRIVSAEVRGDPHDPAAIV